MTNDIIKALNEYYTPFESINKDNIRYTAYPIFNPQYDLQPGLTTETITIYNDEYLVKTSSPIYLEENRGMFVVRYRKL